MTIADDVEKRIKEMAGKGWPIPKFKLGDKLQVFCYNELGTGGTETTVGCVHGGASPREEFRVTNIVEWTLNVIGKTWVYYRDTSPPSYAFEHQLIPPKIIDTDRCDKGHLLFASGLPTKINNDGRCSICKE
jgi:hypothetical protein